MRTVYPIGTTVYDPSRCSNGYTLLNAYARSGARSLARVMQSGPEVESGDEAEPRSISPETCEISLIDMNGRFVHGWDLDAMRCPTLFGNGNLLASSTTGRNTTGWCLEGRLVEVDWAGNPVWEASPPASPHAAGATAQRLENGNTLFLYKVLLPDACRPRISDSEARNRDGLLFDCIAEATPNGETIWNWKSYEHLDLDGWLRNDPGPNMTHFNNIQALPENKWFDAGDERFRPGNILVSPRNLGFIFIISKDSGDLVWRYTGDYLGGLAGQHSPRMIEKGMPGEGNILIFDNGQPPLRYHKHGGHSVVLEIDPTKTYFGKGQDIVWKYENGHHFYNSYGGHCERLPNGNTLITESHTCRVFEVTTDQEVVWEFVRDPAPWRLIMDAHRVPHDHCPQLAAMPEPAKQPVIPPSHTSRKPF